jgi:hypothetical protein
MSTENLFLFIVFSFANNLTSISQFSWHMKVVKMAETNCNEY